MTMKLSTLALAISAVIPAAYAATADDTTTKKNQTETMVVQGVTSGDFTPGGEQLVPAYLDGQIAHGGRIGMLGEQKAMDVPFNVIGYTSKLVQDQQAKTIADVVKNDAGVQAVQGYGNFAETYRIRGFKLDGDDMTMGGLSGVVPRQVMDTQMLERIEVFKGANALVNGAASSGVGGMINLEPKRAEDIPTTRIGVDYTGDSQVGGALDLGRRFGDDNQFGARVNLLHREGKGALITTIAVPRWPRWGWTTAAIASVPLLILATRKRPSTAVRWGLALPTLARCRRCQATPKIPGRNGATAISKMNSVWPKRNTI